ncbi:MAG: hypothetical protein JKY67_20065 [Pseudomonadales bacterium]|nr:hypothetical protein [Pseudomonadales bacterium]
MLNNKFVERFGAISLLIMAASACTNRSDTISIQHDPVVATSSETVTFDATASTDSSDYRIRLFVNGSLEKTCYNSLTCSYTGGPYLSYEGSTVSFAAALDVFDCDNSACDKVDGYYDFGITDASYVWGTTTYIPAKVSVGTSSFPSGVDSELLIHMATDYLPGKTFADFVSDVHDKIYDVYAAQSLIKTNMKNMDIYVYTRTAGTGSCGSVAWQTNTEVPWRDNDAVLHDSTLTDCTDSGLTRFTAEGSNTTDFLHHSGHAVFGLADEGTGALGYFQATNEPNIFSSQAACQSEQNLKGRSPGACNEFSAGWWGIHSGTTVMSNGAVGDSWGTEAFERVQYYFNNL